MGKLEGRIALITGGTRGIGRATALKLAEEGASPIVLNYLRNAEAADEAKALLEEKGTRVELIRANVGVPKDVKAMFEKVRELFGRLDILVCNAALGAFRPITELKFTHWNLTLNISARGVLLCAQEAARMMGEGGKIVSLSSLGSHHYLPYYGAIGVSKAAIECLTRYLAVELAPKGINVNVVSGGPVDTDSLRAFPNFEEMERETRLRTPAGRIGRPGDIADVVSFLCTADASWIYGQTIIADGGLSLI